jgi:hypothetical protein
MRLRMVRRAVVLDMEVSFGVIACAIWCSASRRTLQYPPFGTHAPDARHPPTRKALTYTSTYCMTR